MESLVFEKNDQPMTDSLRIAQGFGKQHQHVMRDIKAIVSPGSGVSSEFTQSNFGRSYYKDASGKKNPIVTMTYDGFMMLVMGYHGKRAMGIKEQYISEFNRMRSFIGQLSIAKSDFHEVTEAIRLSISEPHSYDFTNEFNLIDIVVLGMTAKKFKQSIGISKEEKSIRPFLSAEQLDGIVRLQKFDASLIIMGANYEGRKRTLSEYWKRIQNMRKPALVGVA